MSAYDRHQTRQHQAGREHQQRAGEWATRASRLRMYGHLMPGNEGEAADRLDTYLERAQTDAEMAEIPA